MTKGNASEAWIATMKTVLAALIVQTSGLAAATASGSGSDNPIPSAAVTAKPDKSGETVQIPVSGMVCGFCAQGIEKKFKAQSAVQKVQVSLSEHRVTLVLRAGESMGDDRIADLLKEAGYKVAGSIERK